MRLRVNIGQLTSVISLHRQKGRPSASTTSRISIVLSPAYCSQKVRENSNRIVDLPPPKMSGTPGTLRGTPSRGQGRGAIPFTTNSPAATGPSSIPRPVLETAHSTTAASEASGMSASRQKQTKRDEVRFPASYRVDFSRLFTLPPLAVRSVFLQSTPAVARNMATVKDDGC